MGGAAVVSLVASALAVGSPVHQAVVDVLDGTAWLVDKTAGAVMLANGSSAEVDLRMAIEGAGGHDLEVVRVGDVTLLIDRTTGEISRLDVAGLGVGDGDALPGDRVDLLPVGGHLVAVDQAAGVVELQDPATLEVADSVEVGGSLTRAVVDDDGTVWVADVEAGEALPLAIEDDAFEPGDPVDVPAHPGGQLTAVDGSPALLDVQQGDLIRLGRGGAEPPVSLPLREGEAPAVPRTSEGGLLPLSANRSGDLVVVDDGDQARRVGLDRAGHELGEPVTFDGRIYVPDFTNGTIAVVTPDGTVTQAPVKVGDGGRFSVRVEGQRLWIDHPGSDTAYVLDRGSQDFRAIDHARGDVPSNLDPPSEVGPPAPSRPQPTPAPAPAPSPAPDIPPSPPGAPGAVTAAPGDESAVVSWGAAAPNGAAIDNYTIAWTARGDGGNGQTTAAGNQLQLTVDGLDNGTEYVFRVSATNAAGTGPEATSPPVVPDGEVPDPPEGVTADANDDGTVAVSWQAADPNGPSPVTSYDVTATGDDDSTVLVAREVAGRSVNVGEGAGLVLGTSYTFTVTATNAAGAASEPSEPSDAVVPHRPADAPGGLTGTGSDQAIEATWDEPALGGGTLVGYQVTVEGGGATVFDELVDGATVTVDGLANGTDHTVTVAAVTEVDGAEIVGEPATSQPIRPGRAPSPTNMTASADDLTLSWSFSVDENDSGPATCTVFANGDAVWGPQTCSGNESGSFTGDNGTQYTVYAVAENDYGSQESNRDGATTTAPKITISKGSTNNIPASECSDPSCRRIRVELEYFPANRTFTIQCHASDGSNFEGISATTDGNGHSVSEPCFYGFPGRQVWVTANGVTSNRITW